MNSLINPDNFSHQLALDLTWVVIDDVIREAYPHEFNLLSHNALLIPIDEYLSTLEEFPDSEYLFCENRAFVNAHRKNRNISRRRFNMIINVFLILFTSSKILHKYYKEDTITIELLLKVVVILYTKYGVDDPIRAFPDKIFRVIAEIEKLDINACK